MQVPQEINSEILYHPIIPLLGIYAKKGKPQFEKRHAPLCLLKHYL